MGKEKVPMAERVGAAVAGLLIVLPILFGIFAPSEGASIGAGVLLIPAGLLAVMAYGIGRWLGERQGGRE